MKFSSTKYGDLSGSTYDGSIDVSSLKLTSLEGAPKVVKGNFNCSYNTKLTSLKGSPDKVDGHFECYSTSITSLKGSPDNVDCNFNCSNTKLTSLEGAPNTIGGNFWCRYNPKLTQDGIYVLLHSYIKGSISVPDGLTAPTKEDFKLFNKLGNMKKFLKIKELKAKLK